MSKEIFKCNGYRIIEIQDECPIYKELEGDCFDPEVNKDISPELLLKEKYEFRDKIDNEGVYGYELQKWNPQVGIGWEHVESCWGFVGTHKSENHYAVSEFEFIAKGA